MDNYVYLLYFTHITSIVLNANVLLGHVAKIPSSSLQRTSHMENESVFNGILSVSNNRNQNQSSLITRPIYWLVYTHASSVAQPCPTLCNLMDCSPSDSSVHGFSQEEYWSGLPLPPPGDLPDPEIEQASPALAGSLFTTVIPGKTNILVYYTRNSMSRSSFRYFINQKLNQYYSLKLLFQILCFYFSPAISLTCFPL